jgi:hypothetical protein
MKFFFLRLVAVFVVTLSSTACFSSQTVIKLRPDGSGTIEQTNLVNASMLGMASGMAKSVGGEQAQGAGTDVKPDDLFSEEQLKKQAERLGTGVRFVSSERLTEGAMQGARAVYAFDRIDDVSLGSRGARRDGPGGSAAPEMQFALTPQPGNQSRLTVTFPERKTAADPALATEAPAPQAAPQIPPEAFAMVKSMFEGARMTVNVEVDGRIVGTNAPASSGSRATLVEVDFGELLSDPTKLQALQTLKPGADFATVRKTLEGVKGVKMPTEPTVTIDFAR